MSPRGRHFLANWDGTDDTARECIAGASYWWDDDWARGYFRLLVEMSR